MGRRVYDPSRGANESSFYKQIEKIILDCNKRFFVDKEGNKITDQKEKEEKLIACYKVIFKLYDEYSTYKSSILSVLEADNIKDATRTLRKWQFIIKKHRMFFVNSEINFSAEEYLNLLKENNELKTRLINNIDNKTAMEIHNNIQEKSKQLQKDVSLNPEKLRMVIDI